MTFEQWYESNFGVNHKRAMRRIYEEAYSSGWKSGYREGHYDGSYKAPRDKEILSDDI